MKDIGFEVPATRAYKIVVNSTSKSIVRRMNRISLFRGDTNGYKTSREYDHAQRMKRDQAHAICRRHGVLQPTEAQLEAAIELHQ